MFIRIEVATRPEFTDPGADALMRKIKLTHQEIFREIRWARLLDVYWISIPIERSSVISSVTSIFRDQALNWLFTGDLIPSAAGRQGGILDLFDAAPYRAGKFWGVEKRYRQGVTDNVGRTVREAFEIVLARKLPELKTASGKMAVFEGPQLNEDVLSIVAKDIFCNELIESWSIVDQDELKKSSRFHSEQVKWEFPKEKPLSKVRPAVEEIRLQGLSDSELEELSKKRLLALSLEEMRAIQSQRDVWTDVEIEVIAQTWSEHCKHKIFNAEVTYRDRGPGERPEIPNKIESLFRETISGTTQQIPRDWLLSVFDDNAGIVSLSDDTAFCIKVETHNSPSALDPYGGALTGIVGVNRDILGCGRGAQPLFNTNVFCLAVPDYLQTLPERVFHPRRILDGVRLGVEDGGNKSGIPTVNGALVFDDRYLGKPLIYCGTGGVMPKISGGYRCESKDILPGDRICMVGGRVGKDGIHGATFSSLKLDESAPQSAVQLGDPITQKRMSDFLMEARDLGLYRTLTDNGAGGLSSSIGELARITGGARIDISLAKTKYPGLKPYELVISESQERMTVAVPPENLGGFLSLAEKRGVEVSHLGEFNQSGSFEIFFKDQKVGKLDLQFLHDGVPKLKLPAVWNSEKFSPGGVQTPFEKEAEQALLTLLSRPNIASKEWLVRQYDHEVQGKSVIKPLHSVNTGTPEEASGPNDGAVSKVHLNAWLGVSVGCGINPKLSDFDPYLMAQSAVDEAVRNVLAVGGEYGSKKSVIALVDNFCWPDPIGNERAMGALVRACYGMRDAALALQIPLISGKDSMKNDYRGKKDGKDILISVPPTLLMTCTSRLPDIRLAKSSDFKLPGDSIYLLGGSEFSLLGSELYSFYIERLRKRGGDEKSVVLPFSESSNPEKAFMLPRPNWDLARNLYSWLGRSKGTKHLHVQSVHDVSEGGVLVSVAESLIARGLGAQIQFPVGADMWSFGFGEGFHSFVVSVKGSESSVLEEEWLKHEIPYYKIGTVNDTGKLEVFSNSGDGDESKKLLVQVPVMRLRNSWNKKDYWE